MFACFFASLAPHAQNMPLMVSTNSLIQKRWHALRLLRSTQLEEFNRLVEALGINNYRHLDPFNQPSSDPTVLRKRAVREECVKVTIPPLWNAPLSTRPSSLI